MGTMVMLGQISVSETIPAFPRAVPPGRPSGALDAAFVGRFFAGMPPVLAASFDDRQLFAIQQAFGAWDGRERRRGWHRRLRLPWGSYRISFATDRALDATAREHRTAWWQGFCTGTLAATLLAALAWAIA